MPILLPVLVRRSVRSSTVAATRPTELPAFTERQNSDPFLHAQLSRISPYSSSGWPDRKKPTASYSFCSRTAAGQGS